MTPSEIAGVDMITSFISFFTISLYVRPAGARHVDVPVVVGEVQPAWRWGNRSVVLEYPQVSRVPVCGRNKRTLVWRAAPVTAMRRDRTTFTDDS